MRLFITAFVFLLSSISLSQGWPEGTIYKSQNPNEVIPKKTVTINGAKFDAYLCKEYRDWNDGSYTKLKSKYWYILPHDSLAISAIRDTSNTWNYRDDLWYLPYLDGTIENGYFNYYDNGSIESIGVSNKTWPLSNKTKIFNGLDDDHMFPIKNKWYKPDVKIDCDEYGSCIKTISYEAVDCGMSISRGKGLSNSDEDKFLDDFLSKALVIKQDFIDLNEDFRLHIILRKFGGESTSDYNEGQLRICLGGKFKEYNNGKTYYSWGFDMATENDEDHDAFQIIKDRRKQNYSSEYITIKTTRVRKGIKFQTNKQSKYNVDYSTLDPWMFNVNLIKISENLFFNLNDKTKLVEKFIPYKTNNIALKAMNYSNDTQIWEVLITQEIDIEEYLKPNRVYNVTELPENAIGNGSAVLIDGDNGYLVTNYHVVEAGRYFQIKIKNELHRAHVVQTDAKNDLAILKLENKIDGLTSIPISIHSKIGDKIYSAGFPLISEMGESLKVTEGIISSTSFLNDHTKYQISCPITKGNSGGALVNEHGSLVGVTQGGYRPDLDTENVNAAVKSLYIMSLSQAESECKINIVNSEGGNIDFDVIKNMVFPIFIY